MTQYYRLVHNTARRLAMEAVKAAPDGHIVEIKPETRNLSQNSLMWALLTDMSKQIGWYGKKLTQEEWKDVMSAALNKQKVVPGIEGNFVVCGQRTSKMNKKDFAEMVELIYAFGTQQNVKWSEPERDE